jgi:hypothetical protein
MDTQRNPLDGPAALFPQGRCRMHGRHAQRLVVAARSDDEEAGMTTIIAPHG